MSHNSDIKNWKGANVYSLMPLWDTPRVNVHNDPDLRNHERLISRRGWLFCILHRALYKRARARALYIDPPVNRMTDRHGWKHVGRLTG